MSDKKTSNENLVIINGKIDPALREKVLKLAQRKAWTVSQTVRHIIKTHFSKAA